MNVDEVQRILKEMQRMFIECVDAKAIAQKAQIEEIIPEAVENQINDSKSSDAAKNALFKHLHDQALLEDLRHFCSIMMESKGYKRMQMFGKRLSAKLEEVMPRPGSSQVSSAAAARDVEMEGSIEQQHTLGSVQRERPLEDHADREWKQQKDFDSAVHAGEASYVLSAAWRKRPSEDHADREWKQQKDSDSADRKAVVAFVRPVYDVEEADHFCLEKAIKTVAKNKKLDPLKLKKDLYQHTYVSVERILEDNAQYFRRMVRAAELATEDEEDAKAVTTTRTVAELLDKLHIKTKWENTEPLVKIVLCLPKEPRTLARSLLKRYEGYLEVFDHLVPAQDSLQMQLAVPERTKPQVPVEVTVSKCLAEFMNKDCKDIVNLLLHNSYKNPRIKMATDIETGGTTVVFLIDKAFTENIIHCSRKVSSLWAFQELCVTRVRLGDFELNVVQLLTQHFKEALRSGLTGSMDFVGATKALPYQVYALVDPDIAEKLVIQTLYRKIAHPCPEREELVSDTADSEGVETTPEMHEENFPPKVEEKAEPHDEGKIKEATDSGELLSHVEELEDKLKNSEWKRMDLTHENMALVNRLKFYQEQRDHTELENASLKKKLLSILSSQGGADKDSALTAPSDVRSKRIPHRWWMKVSAGSYDTSLLPSSPMKQAEGGREIVGEVVFRRDTKSNLLKAVSGTEWMYQRGALERGRRDNLRRHQFTRYHRRWLADNVQKEEEDSCKLWLLQSSPDVGSVREREEHRADEGKMSEEVTGSVELLSRVQELADELKDSERKRMELIQSNTALQKILKACREQEVRAQQEIASLWERMHGADKDTAPTAPSDGPLKSDNVQKEEEEWLLQSSLDEGSVCEGEEQGLMSKVYKQALRDYQEEIAGVLNVKKIISDVKPYLTEVEYLQVESKSGNVAQVDELFTILLTKGNKHFEGFCHVLEENGYQHWAQQLRSSTDGAETEGRQSLTINETQDGPSSSFSTPEADLKCKAGTHLVKDTIWDERKSALLCIRPNGPLEEEMGTAFIARTSSGKCILLSALHCFLKQEDEEEEESEIKLLMNKPTKLKQMIEESGGGLLMDRIRSYDYWFCYKEVDQHVELKGSDFVAKHVRVEYNVNRDIISFSVEVATIEAKLAKHGQQLHPIPLDKVKGVSDPKGKGKSFWCKRTALAYGFPKGKPLHRSSGTILDCDNKKKDYIAYQVRTESGSSGGPVFVTFADDKPVVVAIHTDSGSKDECNYGTLLWPFLKQKYSEED